MSASLSAYAAAPAPLRPAPPVPVPAEQYVEAPRRALEVIAGRSHRPRIVPALGAVGLMLGIGLLQLLLSIAIGDSTYQVSDLQTRARDLERVAAEVQQDLDVLNSPQNLGNNAGPLRLVPATSNAFMTLHNGRLHGTPEAAASGPISTGNGAVANSRLEGIGVVTGSRTTVHEPSRPKPANPDGASRQRDDGSKHRTASAGAGQPQSDTDGGLIAAPDTH